MVLSILYYKQIAIVEIKHSRISGSAIRGVP